MKNRRETTCFQTCRIPYLNQPVSTLECIVLSLSRPNKRWTQNKNKDCFANERDVKINHYYNKIHWIGISIPNSVAKHWKYLFQLTGRGFPLHFNITSERKLNNFDFTREHKYTFSENKCCLLLPCWSIYGNVLSLNLPKQDNMSGDSTFGNKTI